MNIAALPNSATTSISEVNASLKFLLFVLILPFPSFADFRALA